MDYKEKVIALLNSQELSKEQKEKLENIFPELKESEDEIIKKMCIEYLDRGYQHCSFADDRKNIEKCIAWLEKQDEKSVNIDIESMVSSYKQRLKSQGDIKNSSLVNMCLTAFRHGVENVLEELNLKKLEMQGEKVTNINGEDYGIDGLYHAIRILERTVGKVTGYQSDDGILEHKAAINAVKELYEKQGEQKPFDYENVNIQQKDFAPKVEPKFKVGNWYQCTKDFFGKGVTFDKGTAYYCAKEGCLLDGCHIAIVKDLYNNFKLWTIEDAKDGDVLVEDSCIFIIQKLGDNNTAAKTYCTLYNDGDFDDGSILYFDIDSTKPATEEQRDMLFHKMKEKGYEWNSEKKELKTIEVKTLNSNKVIAWLVANICDFEYYVKLFKKDFGLC